MGVNFRGAFFSGSPFRSPGCSVSFCLLLLLYDVSTGCGLNLMCDGSSLLFVCEVSTGSAAKRLGLGLSFGSASCDCRDDLADVSTGWTAKRLGFGLLSGCGGASSRAALEDFVLVSTGSGANLLGLGLSSFGGD